MMGLQQELHLPGNAGLEVARIKLLREQLAAVGDARNLNHRRSDVDSDTGGGCMDIFIESHTISLMSVSICL